MSETLTRHSPIRHLLETRQAQWGRVGGMEVAMRMDSVERELERMKTLGLCDLSCFTKLGVKGRHAATWLRDRNVAVPSDVYGCQRLPDGGFVVGWGTDEFFLESGIENKTVPALVAELGSRADNVFRVPREDATFMIVGSRSLDALAETCAVDLRIAAEHNLILTRVAGVSCGILPETLGDQRAYRLWFDPSYAVYLWETLVAICEDHGGGTIGAGCLYAELS